MSDDEVAYYTPDTENVPEENPDMVGITIGEGSLAEIFPKILEEMTFGELLEASALLENAVKDRAQQERDQLVAQAQLVSTYLGVEPQALFDVKKPAKSTSVVKFRHPSDTKKTWTGKGRQPDWVKELVSAGTPLESLAA